MMGAMGDQAPQPDPDPLEVGEDLSGVDGYDLDDDGEDLEAEDQETTRLSRRFGAGIALIIASLVLGKLVLIPLLLFPDSHAWRVGSIVAYLVTWVMLVPGLALAGTEGYRLSRRLYKDYRRRTLVRVRAGGRRAALGAVKVARRPVQDVRKVARGTVELVKKPVAGGRKVARGTVELARRPLKVLRKDRDPE
jgi:hypothetical protein